MPNSTFPEDDDILYEDPYATVDTEDTFMLGNDTRQVSPEEIKVLFLIVENIIHYTQVLRTIALHSHLDTETREKCMENEQERIEYMKKIKKECIKILSWGKSRTPYIALCQEGGPLGGDSKKYILKDALKDLNEIFQQFSV